MLQERTPIPEQRKLNFTKSTIEHELYDATEITKYKSGLVRKIHKEPAHD